MGYYRSEYLAEFSYIIEWERATIHTNSSAGGFGVVRHAVRPWPYCPWPRILRNSNQSPARETGWGSGLPPKLREEPVASRTRLPSWSVIVASVVITGAIAISGWLTADLHRLGASLTVPPGFSYLTVLMEVVTGLLIMGFVLVSTQGAISAFFCAIFGLLPTGLGALPAAPWILYVGEGPVMSVILQSSVHQLCIMWFAASILAVVQSLRRPAAGTWFLPNRLIEKPNQRDSGAARLARYLRSVREEMGYVVQSLGKRSTADLTRSDLAALSRDLADVAGIAFVGSATDEPATEQHTPFPHLARRHRISRRPEHRVH